MVTTLLTAHNDCFKLKKNIYLSPVIFEQYDMSNESTTLHQEKIKNRASSLNAVVKIRSKINVRCV